MPHVFLMLTFPEMRCQLGDWKEQRCLAQGFDPQEGMIVLRTTEKGHLENFQHATF